MPNLLAMKVEVPALAEGYATLSRIFDIADLSETERQIFLMTNNRLNGCFCCMAAHTTNSGMKGVPEDVMRNLRAGTKLSDPKLDELRRFAVVFNERRGWPSDEQVEAFLNAGYSRRTMLEVILGPSLKVTSNYTNHIAATPPDDEFSTDRREEPVHADAS
ncbi:carboxymuconolactone decarboxylase family protein [Roseobacter sp.]|uniref:carboxymuconolactone decarboxylase family protein n=1 Tax=Roseobacter sp. TaxID=1907202 RepID=UPI0025E0B6BD|nr:carboxymuconolactone decarboxylase family protein [Roseobacter sp.]